MSSSSGARLAVGLGVVAVLAIPIALIAAAFLSTIDLLDAAYAGVPVALVAGLAAVGAYRRARARLERTIRRSGERVVRTARALAFAGLYLGVVGALALGFYGLLHSTS
jgi:hypothetical protein